MKFNGVMGTFYQATEWIMRLAYVNLLWILFALTGLIIFGIFPSTIGLFAVVRKWVMGKTDISVFNTYWVTFRSEFAKTNLLGYIFLLIGYILYVDLRFLQVQSGVGYLFLSYLLIALFIMYLFTFMHFFPVFVQYDIKMFQYFKQSFMIMILQPFITIAMIIGGFIVYLLMIFLPGLIPFFGVSTTACVLMWIDYKGFVRLERQARKNS